MTRDATTHLELRRRLLSLPAPQRVDALLAQTDTERAVRALSAQELYLTVLEAGLDQAAPLLPLASAPQLEFFLDVGVWSGDALDRERLCAWLALLYETDRDLPLRLLREADERFLVLALSELLHVYKNDESADPSVWPPDRPLTTVDDTYFIEPREGVSPEAFEALHHGLRDLRGRSSFQYEALLEQVLWRIPAESLDAAYGARASRLAEKGFPELSESLEVWSPGPDPLREVRARWRVALSTAPDPPPGDGSAWPIAPASAQITPILAAAAATLAPQQQEALAHGLVRQANRFAVASLASLGDPATHRIGLETALAHANLGLESLLAQHHDDASHSPDATPDGAALARRALAEIPPAELIRIGTGAVAARAYRARRLDSGWLRRIPSARARLQQTPLQTLEGVLAPRPWFPLERTPRPFRFLADLVAIDRELAALEEFGVWLEQRLQLAAGHDLAELDPLPAGRIDGSDLHWSEVLLTAALNAALGLDPRPRPLSSAACRSALAIVDPEWLRRWCAEQSLPACARWLVEPLRELAAAFTSSETPDPRFARAVLLRAER